MSKAIARVGKDIHLNSLMAKMPFVFILFISQCFVMKYLIHDINIGNYATFLAVSITFIISAIYMYDKHHHVLIFEDKIILYFEPIKIGRTIMLKDIESIIVPKSEVDSSSMIIKTLNNKKYYIHFVDYPHQVKDTILYYKEKLPLKTDVKLAA